MSLRYPINFRNSFKFKYKTLNKRLKDFENKIKKLVTNSMVINNRELTERNVTLLAEIQELKNEKLELFERFMFSRQNTDQTIPKSDLMVLLETIRSLDKDMVEMFEKTHNFYNQMINKISDKIEELVENENNSETALNNVNNVITPEVGSAVGSTVDKPSKSQQVFETISISRQTLNQGFTFGTPILLLDISERPEINPQSYDSFNTTITGTENMITSLTLNQKRLSEMEANLRASSRVSMNPYFSPRIQRPSLIEIQNVMENKQKKEEPNTKRKKCRKQSANKKFKLKTETNDSIDCQTNDENMDTTKKKSKTLDTTFIDSDVSDVSLNCSLSLKRNTKQISYKPLFSFLEMGSLTPIRSPHSCESLTLKPLF